MTDHHFPLLSPPSYPPDNYPTVLHTPQYSGRTPVPAPAHHQEHLQQIPPVKPPPILAQPPHQELSRQYEP